MIDRCDLWSGISFVVMGLNKKSKQKDTRGVGLSLKTAYFPYAYDSLPFSHGGNLHSSPCSSVNTPSAYTQKRPNNARGFAAPSALNYSNDYLLY